MDPGLAAVLRSGDLQVEGRLAGASNATLRCIIESEGEPVRCVYKPQRGERPLWDFPEGTLAGREVAFYELSVLLGWPCVPMTVWREDGPAGPGSCQWWIDSVVETSVVDVVPIDEEREGWAAILEGTDGRGREVRLIHATTDDLQRLALLDAIANNADRKGGHILVGADGRIWGIDHGVTFNAEPKLRSVLWGWAGDPIPEHLLADVQHLAMHIDAGTAVSVTQWLDEAEQLALRERVGVILADGTFPLPSPAWPAIPWPVF